MSLQFVWSIACCLCLCCSTSSAWTVTHRSRRTTTAFPTALHASGGSAWSVTDDWENLSSNHERQAIDDNYNTLQALRTQTYGMDEKTGEELSSSVNDDSSSSDTNLPVLDMVDDHSVLSDEEKRTDEDDVWLQTALDDLLSQEPPLADQVDDDDDSLVDESYGQEITRMVRCNEDPVQLLYATGGAIAPLPTSARDDIRQLLEDETSAPTTFLQTAVTTMFERSASSSESGMDASDVAAWMQQCLGTSVTTFDPRVRSVLSNGVLTQEKFHELYTTAAQLRPGAVWRDLRAHGIFGPNEMAHRAAEAAVAKAPLGARDLDSFVDECAFLTEEEEDGGTGDRYGTASFKDVDMVPGTDHPLIIRDGEFGTSLERSFTANISCCCCTLSLGRIFQFSLMSNRA